MANVIKDCSLVQGYYILFNSCITAFKIKVSVLLDATKVYEIHITDKFGNLFVTLTTPTTNPNDILIPIEDNDVFPLGMFNEHAGLFSMQIKQLNGLYWETLVLGASNQSSISFEFQRMTGFASTIGIIE
jgi:hypothetical protein